MSNIDIRTMLKSSKSHALKYSFRMTYILRKHSIRYTDMKKSSTQSIIFLNLRKLCPVLDGIVGIIRSKIFMNT